MCSSCRPQEAIRYNEPFKVYRQMALNFEQSGKLDEAESLYTTMLKKYKQNAEQVCVDECLPFLRSKFKIGHGARCFPEGIVDPRQKRT
jgi:hypothetical protein